MDRQISTGLKTTFLIHAIVAGLVGLQHLLVPRWWTDLAGMEISETVTWRMIGAALIAFAVSSLMGWRQEFWDRVRIIVIMEIVFAVLGALVIIWGILFEDIATLEWLNVAILTGFAIAFTVLFLRMRVSEVSRTGDRINEVNEGEREVA